MVGIVIVSHSKKLADGVKELADQMVQGRVPVAAAGGIDDPDNEIGTDAMKVFAAIESVYDGDGVLVLMDLGSALMSAELAVEMLPEAYHSQVMLCEAPIVEGAMAAVVQADGNGTLGQVANEARGALRVKATQLGVELPVRGGSDGVRQTPDNAGDLPQITLTIHNKMGLHARPAAQFVSTVNRFHAEVRLTKGDKSVNAKSINQVATLGVRQGNVVTITAVGDDAAPALAAIQALADDNFGETDAVVAAAADEQVAAELEAGVWCGIAASPGIAIGPVFQFRPQLPAIELRHNQDPDDEWQRLQAAVSAAKDEINSLYQHARRAVGDDEAAIFQAHLLILQDPDLLQNVRSILDSEKINVEAAWDRQIQTAVAAFADLTDPYLQARAADAADVGNRVLRHLLGVSLPTLNMTEPVILVAADLTPSDTAQLDRDKILGICTELGGSTAHSAILARALGIPAIVGAGALPAGLADGQMIALDGSTGRIWPDPTEEQLAALVQEKAAWDETRQIQKQ
ncbi:MAG: PTS-dependent dihydroxyacetone kinase phosphotransferase subunit DhaM, partial [Anaerolineales bacterium]|nr:PTS-dependent dihydroxyacetone kinase phosphotransferase subunit DhaM [Anaerolineales bacterium]